MVMFLTDKLYQFSHAHLISKQNRRSHLNYICDRKNKAFDEVVFRSERKSLAYEILSKVELPKFIIELKSQD